MNNTIVRNIKEQRQGMYCHALEVATKYELESAIEQLIMDFTAEGYNKDEMIEFFDTISIYALDELEEQAIYNFDINNYINELLED